ncbi:hypothetical protein C5167_037289 [Papaver somniferum]|uniref:Uncharacterized protein n=1 Tax=Papaver somniferum TaxID=3469 RepID=A0A4Y7I9N0_PAPSO|nr:hypothetical protein C5167_037289 [Papaver somniferum]
MSVKHIKKMYRILVFLDAGGVLSPFRHGRKTHCLQDKACHYCSIGGRGRKALFLVFWNCSTALQQVGSGTRADSIKNLVK